MNSKTASGLFFCNASRPWIKFEPAEAVLTYRHVCACIKEIDEHKLFRMTGEIIGIGIDKTFLAANVSVKEAFTEI